MRGGAEILAILTRYSSALLQALGLGAKSAATCTVSTHESRTQFEDASQTQVWEFEIPLKQVQAYTQVTRTLTS